MSWVAGKLGSLWQFNNLKGSAGEQPDGNAPAGFAASSAGPRGRGLLAYFSICSAIVVGLTTAALVFAYSQSQRASLIHMTESVNLGMARTLASTLGTEIEQHLATTRDLSADQIRAHPATASWHDRLKSMVKGLSILKIKLYAPEARTVFSSEAAQIGKPPSHGAEFEAVLRSQRTHSQFESREKFNSFNGEVRDIFVVSSYVPVVDSARNVKAVLEIYSDATAEVALANENTWRAAALLLLAFGLLYLALFGIVHRADRTIRTQYSALTDLNESLEQRVAERTAASEAAAKSLAAANKQLTAEIEVREQVERTLRSANAALDEATKAKSQFLANMSHEIRTPMNGIFGMTDLLLRTPLNDRQHRLTTTISQSARNLLTVINDVLDLSRIEAGKLEIDRHEFDLRHCVEGAVDLFSDEATRKGLGLSLFVEHGVPLVVWGDRARLRQIFVNLIGNAVKFTAVGEVSVRLTSASMGAPRIRFEVRDTGMGIDAETKDKLCQPFVQADSSISRRYGGTGLGLSITRHLVQLMGGEVAIESTLGKGTIISFEIGLERGDERKAIRRVSDGQLKEYRVLVVDDRETNREILCHYLDAAGADVVAVQGAGEALTALSAAARSGSPFDAALLDVIMPDQSGLELLQAIVANPELSALKSILVTSMTWAGDVNEVRRLGGHALLTKPVNESELVATVARAIAAELPASRPKDQAPAQPMINARVLLAEDNPVNIEVAYEFLTALGSEVHIVKNGRDAVSACAVQGFDAVLMDCQMPDLDGLAATRLIRERENIQGLARIPIIAMTAHAFAEDKQRCLDAGMDDYLSKPFSERQLATVLERWCVKATQPQVSDSVSSQADAPVTGRVIHGALDGELLTSLRVARPGLLERLIRTYLDHSTETVRTLRSAVELDDMIALTMSAHSLKSASANVGAKALAMACGALERAANEKQTGEVRRLVAEVEQRFEEACHDLNGELVAAARPATG